MKTTLIIFLLFFCSSIFVKAQSYTFGDTLYVVAINGLNLRSTPDSDSRILQKLNNGDTITILQTKIKPDTSYSFQGHWVKIKSISDSLTGYVFDAFISRFPVIKDLEIVKKRHTFDVKDPFFILPRVLEEYALRVFTPVCPTIEYTIRSSGEGAHTIWLTQLADSIRLISHAYYESSSTELELTNYRISEVFYLILNLIDYIPGDQYRVLDHNIRIPKFDHLDNCAVQSNKYSCEITVVRKRHSLSIFFYTEYP